MTIVSNLEADWSLTCLQYNTVLIFKLLRATFKIKFQSEEQFGEGITLVDLCYLLALCFLFFSSQNVQI